MNSRRKFLQQLALTCGGAASRFLTRGAATTFVATAGAATAAEAAAVIIPAPVPGQGVRGQVFEVIVRQAAAGAPWREICAGPMQVNAITEAHVEAELERRKNAIHSKSGFCVCEECMKRGINTDRFIAAN